MKNRADTIESIAVLEHEQWTDWVAGVIDDLPPEKANQFRRNLRPYDDLPEAVKRINRFYASKVLDVIEARE